MLPRGRGCVVVASRVASRKPLLCAVAIAGLLVSGCMESRLEAPSPRNLTSRDAQLLAHPPYAAAAIPEPYLRHVVGYLGREAAGTIVVDSDARFLYLV